jgi:CRISPR-associated protein Cmr1
MRKPPALVPPQEIRKRTNDETITQIRRYELITPLFGGGVEPGVADPVTIIRGASIRGQLRFWWRACRGGEFNGDLNAMKNAEGAIWGTASSEINSTPSQVQVIVEIDENHRGERFVVHGPQGNEIPVHHLSSPYGYVAFPLRDKKRDDVLLGIKFTLKISFPRTARLDVEAALWAWEMFGGIGARTRRGFGALRLVSVNCVAATALPADAPQIIEQNIRQQLATHVVEGTWPDGVPHLSRNLVLKVTNKHASPIIAWQYLIKALWQFRQRRHRGTQPHRPGRSKWPEPDAIRRLTGSTSQLHKAPLSAVDKFPRAAFGLPIIFKFKDDKKGDPKATILKGAISERLGSPLILRPVAIGTGKAESIGLAVILDSPALPPGGLILEGARGNPPVQSALMATEAATIAPLSNPSPAQPDVLKAFLRTL